MASFPFYRGDSGGSQKARMLGSRSSPGFRSRGWTSSKAQLSLLLEQRSTADSRLRMTCYPSPQSPQTNGDISSYLPPTWSASVRWRTLTVGEIESYLKVGGLPQDSNGVHFPFCVPTFLVRVRVELKLERKRGIQGVPGPWLTGQSTEVMWLSLQLLFSRKARSSQELIESSWVNGKLVQPCAGHCEDFGF